MDSRAYRRNQNAIRKAMQDEGGAEDETEKVCCSSFRCPDAGCFTAAPALAADEIEVNEDISVSGDYDWTRFANDHITLNVYNNGLYISDGSDDSVNVVSAFEDLTGIKVNYTTYDSSESLYAKLKSGGVSYDVIFPSDYMVGKMINEGMLAELDMDNIPNIAGVGETYLDRSFDPGNKYSVPLHVGHHGPYLQHDDGRRTAHEMGRHVGCGVHQQCADVQQLPRCLRHRRQGSRPVDEPAVCGRDYRHHRKAERAEEHRAGLRHGRSL